MRLFRTILALMMALSLAALPIGSASAVILPAAPIEAAQHVQHHDHHAGAHAHAHQAAAVESCHSITADAAPATPSLPKHPAKCPLGFCCVGASVGFSPVAAIPVKFIAQRNSTVFPPADLFVPDHAGSPPFRPPRI